MNAKSRGKYRPLGSLLLLGLSVAAICLSAEASAQSAIQVRMTSGNAPPIVLTNPFDYGPVTINGWSIGSTAYVLNDFNGSVFGGLSGESTGVTCTSHPCTADPLEIEVSATGFTLPVVGFDLGACCQEIPAGLTRDLSAFWSASDELDVTTTSIAGFTFTGPLDYGSISTFGRAHAGPSPYSLTLIDTFTADNTGLSLDQAELSLADKVPVPEPAPLLLFSGGLLLLGITRRLAKHRLAALL